MATYTSSQAANGGWDTYMYANVPTTNYEGATYTRFGWSGTTSKVLRGLTKFDLTKGTNVPPVGVVSVVSSAVITLYLEGYRASKTLALYPCLLAWVAAEETWNNWKSGSAWTSGGANSDGNDYTSSEIGSIAFTAVGSLAISLNASGITLVEGWLNGTTANNGFLLRATAETTDYNEVTGFEGATEANRPKLEITYHYKNSYARPVFIY